MRKRNPTRGVAPGTAPITSSDSRVSDLDRLVDRRLSGSLAQELTGMSVARRNPTVENLCSERVRSLTSELLVVSV